MTKPSKFYYPYKPSPQSPLRQSLARRPGLIIAGRGVAAVLGERRAGRAIGLRRAGEIRPMRLLPGPGLHTLLGRRHVDGVMQPPMPARRHLRGLRIAVVYHPAALEPERRIDLAAAGSVIAIAELVGPDRFAIGPGPQLGPERGAVPPGEEAQQEGLDHLDHVGFRLRARVLPSCRYDVQQPRFSRSGRAGQRLERAAMRFERFAIPIPVSPPSGGGQTAFRFLFPSPIFTAMQLGAFPRYSRSLSPDLGVDSDSRTSS